LAALTYVPIYMAMSYFSNPINWPMMILLLSLQMVYVCLVYGPIAAFLVELFPTKIRYTSMSLPYHLGNGWFGGFLPLIRSPEAISVEEVRDFLHHLITVRQLASSSVNQKAGGIRFFYQHVLGREEFQLKVPMKRSGRLPQPLGRTEISRLFDAARNPKHRAILMTAYAGGLRVSELARLKLDDIHADRMLIRVDQGKGRKDRYTLLSPRTSPAGSRAAGSFCFRCMG
jgi:integrase